MVLSVEAFAIIASVILAIVLFIADYLWLFLLLALFIFLVYLIFYFCSKTTCPICKTKYAKINHKKCPNCDGIDFNNILFCRIEEVTKKFRKETKYYWEQYYYDGGPKNLYVSRDYEVFDGFVYTFLIVYKNNQKSIFRTYHESNTFCQRLLKKVNGATISDAVKNTDSSPKKASSTLACEENPPCDKSESNNVNMVTQIDSDTTTLEAEFSVSPEPVSIAQPASTDMTKTLDDAEAEPQVLSREEQITLLAKKHIADNPHWSYNSLSTQLSILGLSDKEIQFAIDNCETDWNLQALTKQLGFSLTEAVYASAHCEADWNEQAIKKLSPLLEYNHNLSYEAAVSFLLSTSFQISEAEYAANKLKLIHDKRIKNQRSNHTK